MAASEVASFETNFFRIAGTSETEILVTRIKHPIRRSLRMFVCFFFLSFFKRLILGAILAPKSLSFDLPYFFVAAGSSGKASARVTRHITGDF